MKDKNVPIYSGFMLCLACLILLSACSNNKPAAPQLVSNPNEVSTYLFCAGDVLFFTRDFAGATELYRMSHNFDKNAYTIKRSIFNSLLVRVLNNQIPVEDFEGYADSLLVDNLLSKDMLEETYNVYLQSGKLMKAKQILDIYFKDYESARAYTSLFYLQEQIDGKKDLKLLQKARLNAGSDAVFLNSLGQLFAVYDSLEAEKTWLLARQYDTTADATINLWNYYAGRKDYPALRKLYASFILPDDLERQTVTLEQALKAGHFLSIIAAQSQIIDSNQSTQILALMQASWYANQDDVFLLALNKLDKMKLSKPEIQVKSAFSACWLLKKDPPKALQAIAILDGKNSLDEFVQLYRAYNDGLFDKADKSTEINIMLRLSQVLLTAPSKVLATPVKDYMVLMSDSLQTNLEYVAPDSVALPCVKYFYDNDRKTYDSYLWLAQYYGRQKLYQEQVAMLLEALEIFPDDAALLNWLGYSYIILNEHLDDAESLVSRALQLAPENPYYLDSLGWLYYLKGNYAAALKQMEIPMTLQKIPSEIAWHIAAIYLALNDYENAKLYTKRALETHDDPEFVRKAEELLKTMP